VYDGGLVCGCAQRLGESLFPLEVAFDRSNDRFLLLHQELRNTGCGRDGNFARRQSFYQLRHSVLLDAVSGANAGPGNLQEQGRPLGRFTCLSGFSRFRQTGGLVLRLRGTSQRRSEFRPSVGFRADSGSTHKEGSR
jgi:hypothetical protein